MDRVKTTARWDEKHLSFGILLRLILDVWRYILHQLCTIVVCYWSSPPISYRKTFHVPGPCFNIKAIFSGYGGMGFSIVKIMGIPLLLKQYLYIETTNRTILQSPIADEVIVEYMCNVNTTTTPYANILGKHRSQHRSLPIIWGDIFM